MLFNNKIGILYKKLILLDIFAFKKVEYFTFSTFSKNHISKMSVQLLKVINTLHRNILQECFHKFLSKTDRLIFFYRAFYINKFQKYLL